MQLTAPLTPAIAVVHVTLVEDAFVAVAVTVAPSATPMKSKVGVLSEVLSSLLLTPESELGSRSGLTSAGNPTTAVGLEGVAAVVPPTLDAVTTARMNFPTEADVIV